jgi:hypothetical protein
MTRGRRASKPVQIEGGKWYVAGHPKNALHIEECCDCALTHLLEYKIENGRIMFRYTVDEKATEEARARRGISKPTLRSP